MEHPETVWLAEYRAGNTSSLDKVVEHYRRPLYGFILRMTEGRDDAEEIFQEVWFRAIRRLDTYESGSFLSWLFRIAHNLVIDRARKRKPEHSLQEKSDEEGLPLEERIESPGLDPAVEAGDLDLGRRIKSAVLQLPDEQREVFLMRTEADLPFKDIAKIQGVSINTALARMQYALAKLREDLRGDYLDMMRASQ